MWGGGGFGGVGPVRRRSARRLDPPPAAFHLDCPRRWTCSQRESRQSAGFSIADAATSLASRALPTTSRGSPRRVRPAARSVERRRARTASPPGPWTPAASAPASSLLDQQRLYVPRGSRPAAADHEGAALQLLPVRVAMRRSSAAVRRARTRAALRERRRERQRVGVSSEHRQPPERLEQSRVRSHDVEQDCTLRTRVKTTTCVSASAPGGRYGRAASASRRWTRRGRRRHEAFPSPCTDGERSADRRRSDDLSLNQGRGQVARRPSLRASRRSARSPPRQADPDLAVETIPIVAVTRAFPHCAPRRRAPYL